MKNQIQKEILSLLDNKIDCEIKAMGTFYTVAEIAKEILLNIDKEELK